MEHVSRMMFTSSRATAGTTTTTTRTRANGCARSGCRTRAGAASVLRARAPRRASDVLARAGANDAGNNELKAPSTPESPRGQQLAYILRTQPDMFDVAVDSQLDALGEEIEREGPIEGQAKDQQLVLFKRIADVRALERRHGLEDIIYTSIIQKFLNVGVDMLPPLNESAMLKGIDLNKLTDGVHSKEALEMVREHLLAVLGQGSENAYSSQLVRMSKLQAAQVYAASIMFGYFVTRADKRFQLDRALGTLPLDPMESAMALEKLFNSASAMDSMDEADAAPVNFGGADFDLFSDVAKAGGDQRKADANSKLTLKQYIQGFDQSTLAQTARIVSMEGVAVAERQTGALFGSIEDLQREMQDAVGMNAATPQELLDAVQAVVAENKVQTLTLAYASQRRLVLEAVAFGAFLRQSETYVDGYNAKLLTPTPRGPTGPPGNSLPSGDDDGPVNV
mmetsp:Transcript_7986/g.26414  ORF Transcript_7986/g.26414 Transcript_7986/m.26414 type:complete len:452 (+) Transcript_7986:83-1438(+)